MVRNKNKQLPKVPKIEVHRHVINWNYLVTLVAIAIFIFSCLKIDVTQDDAYISFRYAANYLTGHGLVYNYGERVEGYTNFLWVMLLALLKGIFGINFFYSSRFMGIISGAGIFYLLYVLLKNNFKKVPLALHASLAIALLCNLSLPYWSIAGLETSAFACVALAAVVAEYRRPQLTPALLVIATLLRPEGALVFVVILINRFITKQKLPWHYIFLYAAPLLPFVAFKLIYYGSLFPNPFYAKSGVGFEYIQSGIEYLWYFTRTVGVYGVVFLIPLSVIKRLWSKYSLLYLYVLLYIVYIVWVGGDVLKVYRFFVPVLPVLYFLFIVSSVELIQLTKANLRRVNIVALVCSAAFSFVSYTLSRDYIMESRRAEKDLLSNMHFMSTMLKKHMGHDISLAASTIGMAGYQLLGHRVIDMLGLTDATIARNPEKVDGMVLSWKERRFNSRYLLAQQPDYILFSTGLNPSAPAEQVLMLHSEFRHKYSTIAFVRDEGIYTAWRRIFQIDTSRDVVNADFGLTNKLKEGIYKIKRQPYENALPALREARQRLGEDFAMLSSLTGDCFLKVGMVDSAIFYLHQSLELDSLSWEARIDLIEIANKTGDTAAANRHLNDMKRLSPWMSDRSYRQKESFRAEEPF